ncbi:MAG TPA: DeoR/GlpR family DNA-binding transcription regulator [Acidimicrobiales bacterium]
MTNVLGTLASEERLRWLAERLAADGSVTITGAADALAVSPMTIRRDLAELEAQGTVRRVRGGAKAIGPEPFALRRRTAGRAKSRIAAKLTDLVPKAGVIAFDASSTVMRLASALTAARDLTVLTNGPDTFTALQGMAGVRPLLTGGELDASTGSLVGPLACRAASQMSVRVFFASAAALDVRLGALETTLDEAEVKRSIAAGSDEVVLALDASKLGAQAVAVGLDWDRIDILVTELDAADEQLEPYRDLAHIL